MELTALLEAARYFPESSYLQIHTDSQNLIGWMTGAWRVKAPHLVALKTKILELAARKHIRLSYSYEPRRSTQAGCVADELASACAEQAEMKKEELQ